MTDIAPTNTPEFTVSELSTALKRTVETTFGEVRVRGEISGFKKAASGHVYLSLKDESAVLDGVIWRSSAGRLSFKPEDGLEVICSGKLTTYPGRSKYQIVINRMEPAGVGALMALLEERKKKFEKEGLFDPAHKKEIPFLPRQIGVVTSPTGAVIKDILHRLADRFPRDVLIWPVLVQGDRAADEITAAIRGFNELPTDGKPARPDLLIVARGGGSIEDLWSFNEENVVRAAFESDIPLISAVGHETDTTLIDYVSDQRAPTPTAAAEMAVPVRSELFATVLDLARRQVQAQSRFFAENNTRLLGSARGLPKPADLFALPQQRFDAVAERLGLALREGLKHHNVKFAGASARLRKRMVEERCDSANQRIADLTERLRLAATRKTYDAGQRLESLWKLVTSLSYEGVLERGFALVWDESGKLVKGSSMVSPDDRVRIDFARGDSAAAIINGEMRKTVKRPQKAKRKMPANNQGKLFSD